MLADVGGFSVTADLPVTHSCRISYHGTPSTAWTFEFVVGVVFVVGFCTRQCLYGKYLQSSHTMPLNYRKSPVTEHAFVWLKIAAPSDLLLDVVRFTNVLTYLLTYDVKTQLVWPHQQDKPTREA